MNFEIISYLFSHGPTTVGALAQYLNLSISRTSRLIDEMLEDKYLTKTQKGKNVVVQINQDSELIRNFMEFEKVLKKNSKYSVNELLVPDIKMKVLTSLGISPKTISQLKKNVKCSRSNLYNILTYFRNKNINLIKTTGTKDKLFSLNYELPFVTALWTFLELTGTSRKLKSVKIEKRERTKFIQN